MTLLSIIVVILIGAPLLLTVAALIATALLLLVGVVGISALKIRDFLAPKHPREQQNHGGKNSRLNPTLRFYLKRTNPPWNRNIRAN